MIWENFTRLRTVYQAASTATIQMIAVIIRQVMVNPGM